MRPGSRLMVGEEEELVVGEVDSIYGPNEAW